MKKPVVIPISFSLKRLGLLVYVLVILAILGYKAWDSGWFMPRTPLALKGEPAVLFFNRHKGCECAVVVYQAAARQLRDWPEEKLQGVRLIEIDLDRRPDLGEQFQVGRAPTLLLLDAAGSPLYRQSEIVTDLEPLDLPLLEEKIREMIDG